MQLEAGAGPGHRPRHQPQGAGAALARPDAATSRTPKYWEDNFGDQADWMRPDGSNAITGFMTQLTLTGGFANKTLFEQAGVAIPARRRDLGRLGRAAAKKVADSQQVPYAAGASTAPATASPARTSPTAPTTSAPTASRRRSTRAPRTSSPSSSAGTRTARSNKDIWVSAAGTTYRAGGRRLHQRPGRLLLFRLAGRSPNFADQDRRQLRLGRDRHALRPGRLHRHAGRRRPRRGQIHQEPGGRRQGHGLSGERADREGVLRAHAVPAGAQGRASPRRLDFKTRQCAGEGGARRLRRRASARPRRPRSSCPAGNGPTPTTARWSPASARSMAGELSLDEAFNRIDEDIAAKVKEAEVAAVSKQARNVSARSSAASPSGLDRRASSGAGQASLHGLIDVPLRWLAEGAGLTGMAAFFLLPNMLIFGDLRAAAARHQLRLFDDRRHRALPRRTAPSSAPSSMQRLLDCANYLDPQQLRRGHASGPRSRNTAWFVAAPGRADDRRRR